MRLLDRLLGSPERAISTVDDYAALVNQFTFNGLSYPLGGVQQTLGGRSTESAPNNFVGYAQQLYGANGVVFACTPTTGLTVRAAGTPTTGSGPIRSTTVPSACLMSRARPDLTM